MIDNDELTNYTRKNGSYFNYGLLIPELKEIAKRS